MPRAPGCHTSPRRKTMDSHHTPLADFEILALAGEGASAKVYRALHRPSQRAVALKLFSAAPGAEFEAAFARETRVTLSLTHANIVQALAAGIERGQAWIALEWVPGHDLGRYVVPSRLLPETLALDIMVRTARALHYAHGQGVLHRDIKPANVRVHLPAQVVKLSDFGIAQLDDGTRTATGVLKGTPAYLAPEILAGHSPSAASDIYALGAVTFELLTGRRPYMADSMGELLRQIARDEAPLLRQITPALPANLEALIARTLHRRPAQRPGSAEEWARLLDEIRARL